MSDAENTQKPADATEGQDGEVRDVDDPKVEKDTDSGGAPEEPDTNPSVYTGDTSE